MNCVERVTGVTRPRAASSAQAPRRQSADLLRQRHNDALRAPEVAEAVDVLVVADLTQKFGTVGV